MAYFGEYKCKLDSKGRLRLPSHLLRQMQGGIVHQFVIHRGFDNALFMYEKPVWDKMVEDYQLLSVYDQKEREFMRYFFRGATNVVMDASDRILLTQRQMDFAGIEDELIVSANLDRIEIWNPTQYDEIMNTMPDDLNALSDEVSKRLRSYKTDEEHAQSSNG